MGDWVCTDESLSDEERSAARREYKDWYGLDHPEKKAAAKAARAAKSTGEGEGEGGPTRRGPSSPGLATADTPEQELPAGRGRASSR